MTEKGTTMSHTPTETALFEMNRLLAEYRRLEDMIAEDQKAEEVEIRRIRDRAADIREPMNNQLQFITGQLQRLIAVDGVLTGKSRSRKMVNGTVGWRKAPDKVQVDSEILVHSAEDNPNLEDLVVTTTVTKPDKKAIMAHIVETGELPPGCSLEEGGDNFWVLADRPKAPTHALLNGEMIGTPHGPPEEA